MYFSAKGANKFGFSVSQKRSRLRGTTASNVFLICFSLPKNQKTVLGTINDGSSEKHEKLPFESKLGFYILDFSDRMQNQYNSPHAVDLLLWSSLFPSSTLLST